MLSEGDRVLIKVEKGYGLTRIMNEFTDIRENVGTVNIFWVDSSCAV